MSVTFLIVPDYAGPTLVELDPILDISDEPVEAAWGGSKQEVLLARKHKLRALTLVVPDQASRDRAAMSLGLRPPVDTEDRKECLKAMRDMHQSWRKYAERYGNVGTRTRVLHMAASMFRDGMGDQADIRKVLTEQVLNQVPTADFDVLLSLRAEATQKGRGF